MDKGKMSEQKLQNIETKVKENGELIKTNSDRLDRVEKKVDVLDAKVEKNGELIKANSDRLDRVEKKVDELDAKVEKNGELIKANSDRLDRVEKKVDELDAKVENNGRDINDLKAGQGRLEEGQKKQQRQIDGYFEFFKAQFELQREESRRHVEVIIESFQSSLQAQGEGVRANRDGLQEIRVEQSTKGKAIEANQAQLADHETRIRKLEAKG